MNTQLREMTSDESATPPKLVFAGPVGAGKTTAIRSITDQEPISTEMPMSEGAMGDKTTTTVGLDFSSVTLVGGEQLLVYGLPGQERFDFMRPIVLAGAVGIVIVIDGSASGAAEHCEHWLKTVRSIQPAAAIVVGVTHTDQAPHFTLGSLREAVRRAGRPVPVFTFDARDTNQTSHLIRALLASVH